jgi:hypothetical protein
MGERATFDAAPPQHLRALEHANRVRLARADLKRQIGRGEASAADIVAEPPWQAASMTISDLLMSQPRWGHTRCRRVLIGMGISETKPVGKLTERQRGAIAEVLRGQREPVDRDLPPPVREAAFA